MRTIFGGVAQTIAARNSTAQHNVGKVIFVIVSMLSKVRWGRHNTIVLPQGSEKPFRHASAGCILAPEYIRQSDATKECVGQGEFEEYAAEKKGITCFVNRCLLCRTCLVE